MFLSKGEIMKQNELRKACDKLISEEKAGTIHGPYQKYSSPYGKAIPSLNARQWFVNTKTGTYEIIQFELQPHRFILPQSYPAISRTTLKSLVKYLMGLKKRLVLCT